MTKDEALKMAIEFMGTLTIDVGIKTWNEKHRKEAIQACKEALEQPTGNSSMLPVAWQWLTSGHMRQKIPKTATPEHWRPLYTHPKEWQGLAKYEIIAIDNEANDLMEFARAIEVKLKEKNA